MSVLIMFVGVVVAFGAAGVGIFAADSARRSARASESQASTAKRQAGIAEEQADAARDQAEAAREQVAIAREQADAAREQVKIAREQADAARDQVTAARAQVEAATSQVVEARRANDLLEAELAERRERDAVKWTAKKQGDGRTIHVRNVGNETAHYVQIDLSGDDEHFLARPTEDCEAEEVRPGDMVSFRIRDGARPPQLYVCWDGAKHPVAVEVIPDY